MAQNAEYSCFIGFGANFVAEVAVFIRLVLAPSTCSSPRLYFHGRITAKFRILMNQSIWKQARFHSIYKFTSICCQNRNSNYPVTMISRHIQRDNFPRKLYMIQYPGSSLCILGRQAAPLKIIIKKNHEV